MGEMMSISGGWESVRLGSLSWSGRGRFVMGSGRVEGEVLLGGESIPKVDEAEFREWIESWVGEGLGLRLRVASVSLDREAIRLLTALL